MRKDFTNGRDLCRPGVLNPVAWWEQFGNDCPDLQKFAVRVLSQCCSLCSIDTDTDTEMDTDTGIPKIWTRTRFIKRRKDALDPISLENIDVLDDWVCEEPSLFDEDQDIAREVIDPPSLEGLTLEDQPIFDAAAHDN